VEGTGSGDKHLKRLATLHPAPNQPLERTAHPTGFFSGAAVSGVWAAARRQRSASEDILGSSCCFFHLARNLS
jgi:hypothetical protein